MAKTVVPISLSRLRAARGNRSASEVARLLNISYQHLWYVETGKRTPSLTLLARLCALYDIPMDRLILKKPKAA